MSTDLPHLKRLAVLLAAEGKLAEMEKRPADAAESYVNAVRLGNEISRGGVLINRLVGIACESIGMNPLERLVPNLSCEQSRPVITALELTDQDRVQWSEIMLAENRFLRSQIRGYRNPIRLVTDLWQAHSMLKKAEQRHNKAVARLRVLTTELALRCYQSEQGRTPALLDDLVPKYLRRVPMDPFSGKALNYRPSGTNWVLDSIGPRGVDKGGSL